MASSSRLEIWLGMLVCYCDCVLVVNVMQNGRSACSVKQIIQPLTQSVLQMSCKPC